MGEAQSMVSLISLFERLEDPRVERTRDYSLAEVLFLVLAEVWCHDIGDTFTPRHGEHLELFT